MNNDGRVLQVAPMWNANRDGGILKTDFQEKSILTKLHHFVHWPSNLSCPACANSFSLLASSCTVDRSFPYAWEFFAGVSGIEKEPKPVLWDRWYPMIFLNSSLAFVLAIASEAIQLPAFIQTDADATKGWLDSQRSSLPLIFGDFKLEVKPFIGTRHSDELG